MSIEKYSKEIKLLQIQNPKWHYNQILSKFKLKYPSRLEGKDINVIEKRKNFRKIVENYKLDNNNRLCDLNSVKKDLNIQIYYKIPYQHEM